MSENFLSVFMIDTTDGGLYTARTLRIPRTITVASSATPTPNGDTTERYVITALAAAAVFGAPTGTPVQGQRLMFHLTDNGTARGLTWNAIFKAQGVTLPTTTVLGKLLIVGCIYDSIQVRWLVVATSQEA